jgi:hypothetical protein
MCVTCHMQRAFESPPTQLTVNQPAGIAVNAAAAAVQPTTCRLAWLMMGRVQCAVSSLECALPVVSPSRHRRSQHNSTMALKPQAVHTGQHTAIDGRYTVLILKPQSSFQSVTCVTPINYVCYTDEGGAAQSHGQDLKQ